MVVTLLGAGGAGGRGSGNMSGDRCAHVRGQRGAALGPNWMAQVEYRLSRHWNWVIQRCSTVVYGHRSDPLR